MYSRLNTGNAADFDYALDILIDAYPHKSSILKASGATGSGATGSNGTSGQKTISRAQLEAMPPADRGAALKGVVLTD